MQKQGFAMDFMFDWSPQVPVLALEKSDTKPAQMHLNHGENLRIQVPLQNECHANGKGPLNANPPENQIRTPHKN